MRDLHSSAKTDITLDRRELLRADGFCGPIGATASLELLHGLGADIKDDGTRVEAVCAIPMPRCAGPVRADVGTGGGSSDLGLGGLAKVHEEDFEDGMVGVPLRLALAHTWPCIGQPAGTTSSGQSSTCDPHQPDVVGILKVGGDGGSSALFSWGLGVGL